MRPTIATVIVLLAASTASAGPIRWTGKSADVPAALATYGVALNGNPGQSFVANPGLPSGFEIVYDFGIQYGLARTSEPFAMPVTITDDASGLSKSFDVGVHLGTWEGDRIHPYMVDFYEEFRLGNTLFQVKPHAESPGDLSYGLLVTARNVADAPEPSTFLLAALGAGGIASLRRRR